MKTITENSTKLSKYLFEDSKTITVESDKIIVGDPLALIRLYAT